jgi:3-deoxy-D-manno-octulosonate 8-phosphate phosphatase KdsC-like HAD superfamily phosphatase
MITGYSFCPSNATPEIKGIVKVVLPFSNEECAVGKMIEMYFLKKVEGEEKMKICQNKVRDGKEISF